jgi:hypothetical protein
MIVLVIAGLISAVVLTRRETGEKRFPGDGDFSAEVCDNDPSQGEGYLNENLTITYSLMSGSGIPDVGNPDSGLTFSVTNLTRGWGPFTADVKGQENYEHEASQKHGYWTVSAVENTYIRWHLLVVPQPSGRLVVGEGYTHLYLWADTDNDEANGYGTTHKPTTTLWDKGDTLELYAYWGGYTIWAYENRRTISGVNRLG